MKTGYASSLATTGSQRPTAGPDAPGSSGAAGAMPQLSEILVTATRRALPVEKTPISMSVLSAHDLVAHRILSLNDVAYAAPSLSYLPQSGSEAFISMRGASTIDDSTGTDQGITMYVDGIARVSTADLQPELFDVNRVEVLNGPQGTLFGENSIGGAIAIHTNDPTFQHDANVQLTAGNEQYWQTEGMVNTPLIPDKLALRVAATAHTGGDYVRDLANHQELGGENLWATRAKLLYTPVNGLRVVLSGNFMSRVGDEFALLSHNFVPQQFPDLAYGPLATANGTANQADQKFWGVTGRVEWTNAVGKLISISGFRRVNVFDVSPNVPDPTDNSTLTTAEHDHQFSQEFRLISPTDQRLTWIAGLYYLTRYRDRPIIYYQVVLPNSLIASTPGVANPLIADAYQDTTTQSYAPYFDATYALASKWKLEGGVRYTWEKKSGYSYINPADYLTAPAASAAYSHSWSAITPKVTLAYTPIRTLMTYATISRGFESGGYNINGSTPASLGEPFSPEYAWNYEAGEKFVGLHRRLQANFAAYLDRYSDLQIIEFDGRTLTFNTTNAGSSEAKGIEAGLEGIPFNWLTVGVDYDYTKAKFTKFVINNGPGTPPTINTGNEIPFVAPNKITATTELHFRVAKLGRMTLGAHYTYRDPIWFTAENAEPDYIRRQTAWRGLVDLYASWTPDDSLWSVHLWAKNVTNTFFATNGSDDSFFYETVDESNDPSLSIYSMNYNRPRTYGVTVSWNM